MKLENVFIFATIAVIGFSILFLCSCNNDMSNEYVIGVSDVNDSSVIVNTDLTTSHDINTISDYDKTKYKDSQLIDD